MHAMLITQDCLSTSVNIKKSMEKNEKLSGLFKKKVHACNENLKHWKLCLEEKYHKCSVFKQSAR